MPHRPTKGGIFRVEQANTPSGMKTVPRVSAALLSAFWMAAVLSVLPSPTALKSRTSSMLGTTAAAPTTPVAVVLMKSLLDTGSDMRFLFAPDCSIP